nr:hypothetical protein [Tanacetum cinerariifolium]
MSAFLDTETSQGVDPTIVADLMDMLDQKNAVAQSFRMAKDWCHSHESVNFELRLLNDRTSARQYNAPTVSEVAALITNYFGDGIPSRDIVVDNKDEGSKRILELHPSYMALQYPLLFPYGEDGGGCLYQQFLVDAFTAVEEQRLKWTRNTQDSLRVDLYHSLNDAFIRGDTNAEGLVKRIVLPRTFTEGHRYMMQNYQDAMALCRAYGNPDLFVTFTSNPKWPEIAKMLSFIPGQKPYERQEVGTRVFKMKLTHLLEDITKYEIFKKSCAVVYIIEFQKRGQPHAHILLWLEEEWKCKTPSQVDNIISTEMPSPTNDLEGYKKPTWTKMGTQLSAVGIQKFRLSKAYINVEWCNRSKAIQYLLKYLNKASDRATFVIQYNVQNGPLGELQKQENSLMLKSHSTMCGIKMKSSETPETKKSIGRIYYLNPAAGDRYYLRMLLNVAREPYGFKELMTVNKKLYPTFKAVCFAYGLLNDDKEWADAINESSFWALAP